MELGDRGQGLVNVDDNAADAT